MFWYLEGLREGEKGVGFGVGVEIFEGEGMAFLSGLARGYDLIGTWAVDLGNEIV